MLFRINKALRLLDRAVLQEKDVHTEVFTFMPHIQEIRWMDNDASVSFAQRDGTAYVHPTRFITEKIRLFG